MRGAGSRLMMSGLRSEPWLLCFTALEANSTVAMAKYNSPPTVYLEYSTNLRTWQTFTVGSTTVTLSNVGDKVWLRAQQGKTNLVFAGDTTNWTYFQLSGSVAASGSIMSLVSGSDPDHAMGDYAFKGLFKDCTALATAPELPKKSLTYYCYDNMFSGCTALSAAPALPATTLAGFCYGDMFNGCSSLTEVPSTLPATVLKLSCYGAMFRDCTSLAATPTIMATSMDGSSCCSYMFYGCENLASVSDLEPITLTYGACSYMFGGCTSLVNGPKIKAAEMAPHSLQGTFSGCTSLASVEVHFTEWPNTVDGLATKGWMYNVPQTGTFKCPAALGRSGTITRGENYCPTGWTVVNI